MSLDISILWQLLDELQILKLNQGQVSSVASFHHAMASVMTLLEGCLADLEEIKNSNGQETELLKQARQGLNRLQQLSAEGLRSSVTQDSIDLMAVLHELQVLYGDKNHQLSLFQPQVYRQRVTLKLVNRMRLTEAICCLINNAFQSYSSQNKVVVLVCYQKKNGVVLQVQDFGQGMNQWRCLVGALPLVSFRKNGSGIGLSFAHQVFVNELGGSLWIQSKPNFGTTVSCYIPKRRARNNQNLDG